jgi:hypothetical protein
MPRVSPTPIDRDPLTRRQVEILIACFRGQIAAAGREGEPWVERILARVRARYLDAPHDDVDDLDTPRVESILPYPAPLAHGDPPPAEPINKAGRARPRKK